MRVHVAVLSVLVSCAPVTRTANTSGAPPAASSPAQSPADDPSCPLSVLDKATGAYTGAFKPGGGGLLFVFRGTLREVITCVYDDPKVNERCSLRFEVTDVPWDGADWFAREVGLPRIPRVKEIRVDAARKFPPEFRSLEPGTEWLVVVQNYGGFEESRFALAPWCGPGGWLASIRDEQVYFDPTGRGDAAQLAHLPWSEVRARILAPIEAVPEIERHQAAQRSLARIEASRPQREEEARKAREFEDQISGKNLKTEDLVHRLESGDPKTITGALYFLTKRSSTEGVPRALELLGDRDDYVWLNAATYLGAMKRTESIPYLIKSLRHTAWRGYEERARMLQDLTGETFGPDFESWHRWWTKRHPEQFDWDSKLGPKPHL